MFLADKLLKSPWPHPRRQRLGVLAVGFMDVVKQVDGRLPLKSACAIMAGREGIEKYIVPCPHGNAIVGCHNFSCHGLSKQPGSATRQDMKEQ
jgi:hypothetical protein